MLLAARPRRSGDSGRLAGLAGGAGGTARRARPWSCIHIEDRPGDFANGHVPGARLVRYDEIAVDGPDQLGSELPALDALREVFHAAGVGAASEVVVYGSAIGATRAFFTLDYLGHPNVRVLNGGLRRLAGGGTEGGAGRRRAGTPRPGHAGPAHAAAPGAWPTPTGW